MASIVNRRKFLLRTLVWTSAPPVLHALGATGLGMLGSCRRRDPEAELLVSAQGSAAQDCGLGWTTLSGQARQLPVGFRGHDVSPHPLRPGRVVLVARHPGEDLVEVDLREGRVTQRTKSTADHVLGGHACFSRDGQRLFIAESRLERGTGRIVVRDALDYRVLTTFASHGLGPHELLLMPDGRTLAVANGGLLTHPSTGAQVLNLDTMASRLSFIDSESGELVEEHAVDEPKASIRHLCLSDHGELSVALQMQREAAGHERLAPLTAIHDRQRGLQVLRGPEPLLWRCKDYMGSTRINNRSRIAGFTSPRGDIALFFHLDSRELVGHYRFHDVCGLAVNGAEDLFVLSNSAGQVRCLDAFTLQERPELRLQLSSFAWDNHMRVMPWPDQVLI